MTVRGQPSFLHLYLVLYSYCSEWTKWLENCFAPLSAERLDDPRDRRILILDAHSSHQHHHFVKRAEVCSPSSSMQFHVMVSSRTWRLMWNSSPHIRPGEPDRKL